MLRACNALISINANISKTNRATYKMFITRSMELKMLNNMCTNNVSIYLQINKSETENLAMPNAEGF